MMSFPEDSLGQGVCRLVVGEDLTVWETQQGPAPGLEQTSTDLVIVIPWAGAYELRWWSPDGLERSMAGAGEAMYLIPPGCRHAWTWLTPTIIVRVAIKSGVLPALFLAGKTAPVLIGGDDEPDPSDIWQVARLLRTLLENPRSAESIIVCAAGALSRGLVAGGGESAQAELRLTPTQQGAIESYLTKNLRFGIQVVDLARQVGLSPSHFAAVFKATHGVTPLGYLTERRLLVAHELLRAGEMRVGEVARAVGYEDQGHFSAKFRAYFGFPPRQVRRWDVR